MQTMKPPRFQAGGSLQPGALYVERPADQELPAALLQGEFCYVLAPRQIGKSSLRIRTTAQLKKEGVRCVTIDLNWIGKRSEAEWYRGLVGELSDKLKLNIDVAAFWDRHEGLTPAYRWSRFLSEETLTRVAGRIVIFVDEIDTVKALSFSTDDFFATVRAVYNMQAEDPKYRRLTFCLLGVAAPKDLISNPVITPFNIGRAIQLDDFSPRQAEAFLPGLSAVGGLPRRLLDAILYWTHGHPYMTQRICEALTRRKGDASLEEEARVAALVDEIFLRQEDTNLEYAARHFDKEFSGPHVTQMLRLYQRLIDNEQVPADKQDPAQMALRLTGMAAERRDEGGLHLRVRNRIFATVFDQNWVKRNQADRLISEPLARWLASGRRDDDLLRGQALEEATEWASGRNDLSPEENEFLRRGLKAANRELEESRLQAEREQAARQAADEAERRGNLEAARALAQQQRAKRLKWATVVLAGFLITTIFLAGFAFQQRAIAQREKSQVELQKNEIEKQKQEVEVQRNEAEEQRNVAEAEKANAEKQRALAEQRSKEAEAARAEAQRQAAIAIEQREVAEKATKQAQQQSMRAEVEAKRAKEQEEIAQRGRDEADKQTGIALANAKEAEEQRQRAQQFADELVKARNARDEGEREALKRETRAVPHLLAIGRQDLARKDSVEFLDNDSLILSDADGVTLWEKEDRMLRQSRENRQIQESSIYQTLHSITDINGKESIVNDRGGLTLSREKNQTAILSRTDRRDIVSGKDKITLHGFKERYKPTAIAISPDKKLIALASEDGKVRVWNDKGKKREVVRPRSALLFYFPREFPWVRWKWEKKSSLKPLHCIAISPDGEYLVTGDILVARVFKISSRKLVAELSGHTGPIKSVSFSPDGKRVATLSADAVRIYKFEPRPYPAIHIGDP